MGGGNAFVDGVLRWFHRRPSAPPSANADSVLTHSHKPTNYSSNYSKNRGEVEEEQLRIVEDFDISGLSSIKVPKRVNFPLSFMDPHRKVCPFPPFSPFLCFKTFLDLSFCFY